MKKSSFAIVSLILSVVLFVPALFIFLITLLQVPESHPLMVVAFPLVLISTLPELPLFSISQPLGFPIVLPALSVLFALISLKKKESKRSLAFTSIVLVVVSIGMYLVVRGLF